MNKWHNFLPAGYPSLPSELCEITEWHTLLANPLFILCYLSFYIVCITILDDFGFIGAADTKNKMPTFAFLTSMEL